MSRRGAFDSDDGHAQTRQYQAEHSGDGHGFLYSEECYKQKLGGLRFLRGATRRSDLMKSPAWVKRAVRTCKAVRVWMRGIPVNFGGYKEQLEYELDGIEAGLRGEPWVETEGPPPVESVQAAVAQATRSMPGLTEFEQNELAAQERAAKGG